MKQTVSLLFVTMVACAPPPPPTAKVWTAREFFEKRAVTKPVFGGWAPSELLVTEGQPIPFTTRTQRANPGLTVFPGVSEGRALGFIITDVWQDHPEPWVQPVFTPAFDTPPYERRFELPTVFPVGLDSTFYSPWWRMQKVPVPSGVTLTSSKQVLEAGVLPGGSLVLCPLISPPTLDVASEAGQRARHPLTGVEYQPARKGLAFVDGEEVSYLDLGMERAPFEGQRLVESALHVFVNDDGPLPVAAVWPARPDTHGWLRRVEVRVPSGAAFFVPSNRPDLRARLGSLAPDVDVSLDRFPQYGLRLVRNPSCFASPAFPTACEWLDSEDVVQGLAVVEGHEVYVSAATLIEVAP